MSQQGEFSFQHGGTERGYTHWITGRQAAVQELAQHLGLPLGQQVEVWLYGGIRLRGKLRLKHEFLFIEAENARHLELQIDKVTFAYREMESCVRL
jgi:small nuclear ribonucleoprotein (snRNP)-like protein